jgi:hypothetical protein
LLLRQRLLVQVVSGFEPASGSTDSGYSVFACPPPSPGIVSAPSTVTISAPPPGSVRRNTVAALAGDESAARIL